MPSNLTARAKLCLFSFVVLTAVFVSLRRENLLDVSDVSTFVQWAESFSVNKEVILAYASIDYKEMGYNCVLSLIKQGVTNVGVLVTDSESLEYFQDRRIPAYDVAKLNGGVPRDVRLQNTVVPRDLKLSRLYHPEWSNRWNNRATHRWQHWMLRHFLALRLLKAGFGVYQTDVDMVFLDNPYDWLDSDADLECQTQDWPNPASCNLGIGHVAATTGGILHWETTNNLMRYLGDDPQSVENMLLIDPLFKQIGSIEMKPCRTDDADSQLCEWRKSPMINFRIWSAGVLPMGYSLPSNNSQKMLGIHVHATFSDYESGKLHLYETFCKANGIWFIPDSFDKDKYK